jgi:hypothetical protein
MIGSGQISSGRRGRLFFVNTKKQKNRWTSGRPGVGPSGPQAQKSLAPFLFKPAAALLLPLAPIRT